VSIILLVTSLSFSNSYAKETARIPGNIFSDYSDDNINVILVEKNTERLFFIKINNNIPIILNTYNVFTGKNRGDKTKEGDSRTPEGIYFITGFIPEWKLNRNLYGVGAFPINYPNIVDRIYNKTGHGIWLHGRGIYNNNRRTNGCISLPNDAFLYLKQHIERDTPVLITRQVEFLSPEKYIDKKKEVFSILETLLRDWEKGDFEAFASRFYPNFRNNFGEGLKEYLERKRRIFATDKNRRIKISDLIVFKENSSELMYQFKQLYCSDRYIDYGIKRIYFEADAKEAQYKVIAEEFFPQNIMTGIEPYIRDFINMWIQAWQAQDTAEYFKFYDDSFRFERGGIKEWREYKERVFSETHINFIRINRLKFKILRPSLIKVTFVQEYNSDTLTDKGIKTLVLKGCPGGYRIITERWNPL
jgi:murein L,D-transpeptidase YafK